MSGSQLTSSVKRGSPTLSTSDERRRRRVPPDLQAVAQRSARLSSRAPAQLEQRLGDRLRRTAATAARRAPPRRRELVGQLAGDRLEHERAAAAQPRGADAADPAARRLGEPRGHRVGDEQRRVALDHALDVRRGGVGLRRPPLLRVPVEAAARDRAHRVDDVGAGRGTRTRRARARGGRRGARRSERAPRGARTVHGTAPLGCSDHVARERRRRRSPRSRRRVIPVIRRGPAARRRRLRGACASTAAARSRSTSTSRGWRTRARACGSSRPRRAARRGAGAARRAGEPESLLRLVVTRGGRRIAIVEPLPPRPASRARGDRHLRADARAQRAQDAVLRGEHARRAARARSRAPTRRCSSPRTAACSRARRGRSSGSPAASCCTPPLDDRILDSITRRRLLEELRRRPRRRARSTTSRGRGGVHRVDGARGAADRRDRRPRAAARARPGHRGRARGVQAARRAGAGARRAAERPAAAAAVCQSRYQSRCRDHACTVPRTRTSMPARTPITGR